MSCESTNATCIPIGPTGAAGFSYEYASGGIISIVWVNAVDTLVTGAAHTITGGTDEYTIDVNLTTLNLGTSTGNVKIKVDGVTVKQSTNLILPASSHSTYSVTYRGTIADGALVEVYVAGTIAGLSATTQEYSWSITKL